MDWKEKYASKIVSAEEAAASLSPSDTIVTAMGTSIPYALLDVIAEDHERLSGMTICLGSAARPMKLYTTECSGDINIVNFFFNALERAYMPLGARMSYQAMHLSRTTCDRQFDHVPTVCIMAGTPPDENGMISLGPCPVDAAFLDICGKTIVQINDRLPFTFGKDCMFPADRVDMFVECSQQISAMPPDKASPEELTIGGFIAERVPDGACIQLGIGGIGAAVGSFFKDKHDLGIHSEMFVEPMVDLMECGAVNNSRKNFMPGKAIAGFAMGSRRMYDFLDGNRDIEFRPFSWVNDPRVISQNDNLVSINGALQIDLTGQVCSESIGQKQFSGTGGQLDFVRGSQWSSGGMSFIALPSSRVTKAGERLSKISLTLPLGSAVTTPRSDVQYIVTEYGVADLRNRTLDERARRLISIAHPDFRDELTAEAKKAGLII